MTSQIGLTRPPPVKVDAYVITTNAMNAASRAYANFAGLDGCRSPIASHNHENAGANATTKIGSTDWNQLDGKLNPSSDVRVSWSANRLRLDPACSKDNQNTVLNTNNTAMAAMRRHSSRVNGACVVCPPDAARVSAGFAPTDPGVRRKPTNLPTPSTMTPLDA